ncbi:MAG: carbonic anhydrase [Thermodesulfobacteriota bacterium]
MRFGKKSFLVLALSLGVGLGAYTGATASDHSHGGKSHHGHWTYEGESGPAHWGDLSHEYSACSKGQSQSPIDISGTSEKDVKDVAFSYGPSKINIVNNGHTVQVNYDKGSSITVDGVGYDLLQFHFHTPSEHKVGGKTFDTEMHLVHKSKDGALAVVGVLIEKGAANPAFNDVWAHLPKHAGHKESVAASVNVDDLLPKDRSSYRYSGSLTTPPCSEHVSWIVLKTPVELSAAQVDKLHAILKDNNRPVQPVNTRKVVSDTASN